MKLTPELLHAANTSGAWTRAQLVALGVPCPPPSGWRQKVIGMEISEEDYQRLCELASVRVKPKKERPGIPDKPIITGKPPDGMDELVTWLTDKLELEKMARSELEKQILVLQFQLEALCREVREGRRDRREHDSSDTPSAPTGSAYTPPWDT
jgi:hypothetical protein